MYQACTIAGSDSGGGAGIQADIKVFAAHGVYGTSVITAVTAQNTRGITAISKISSTIVVEQLYAVFDDFNITSVKTGMLPTPNIVGAVAEILQERRIRNIVIDPVIASTGGVALISSRALREIIKKMFPLAILVTPNIPEAETMTGMKIQSVNDVKKAAEKLFDMGCRAILIKGGHAVFDPATDVLYDGHSFTRFESQYIATKNTHGTGCAYSAAIAARLARGENLNDAIAGAKEYITRAIEQGLSLGKGRKGHGPVNPFPIMIDNSID